MRRLRVDGQIANVLSWARGRQGVCARQGVHRPSVRRARREDEQYRRALLLPKMYEYPARCIVVTKVRTSVHGLHKQSKHAAVYPAVTRRARPALGCVHFTCLQINPTHRFQHMFSTAQKRDFRAKFRM